jgi:hypothetical protein
MRTNLRERVFGGVELSILPKIRFGLSARTQLSKAMIPRFSFHRIQAIIFAQRIRKSNARA